MGNKTYLHTALQTPPATNFEDKSQQEAIETQTTEEFLTNAIISESNAQLNDNIISHINIVESNESLVLPNENTSELETEDITNSETPQEKKQESKFHQTKEKLSEAALRLKEKLRAQEEKQVLELIKSNNIGVLETLKEMMAPKEVSGQENKFPNVNKDQIRALIVEKEEELRAKLSNSLSYWWDRAQNALHIKTDTLGNMRLTRRLTNWAYQALVHYQSKVLNNVEIHGSEILDTLPTTNVLFVSNHQTYQGDLCLIKMAMNEHQQKSDGFPILPPPCEQEVCYIAAQKTLDKQNFLNRIAFKFSGAIGIQRAQDFSEQISKKAHNSQIFNKMKEFFVNVINGKFKSKGLIAKGIDKEGVSKIQQALGKGWVISFVQGTTEPYAPVRKGTARLIKDEHPIVVPIVVEDVNKVFEAKKMFKLSGRNQKATVTFKPALNIDYSETDQSIIEQIAHAIEQSEAHRLSAQA